MATISSPCDRPVPQRPIDTVSATLTESDDGAASPQLAALSSVRFLFRIARDHPSEVIFGACCLLVVAVSVHDAMLVWRWPTGELLHKHRLPNPFFLPNLSFSDEGRCLLSSHTTDVAYLWDVKTGQTVKKISPAAGSIIATALSPHGTYAAVFLSRGEVRVYRMVSGKELWRDQRAHFRGPLMVFSRCGRFLVKTARKPGSDIIIVFGTTSGRTVCELSGGKTPITGLTAAPKGLLYSVDAAGVVRCWDLEQKCEKWRLSTLERGTDHGLFQHGL